MKYIDADQIRAEIDKRYAELLERPFLSSNLDEAAEEYAGVNYDCETETDAFYHHIETEAFKAGADFGAKNMLAKLRENCVIIDKDLYECALEGKFIEGREEGIKWMAEQGVSMLGKVGIYGVDVESITEKLRKAGFKLGEEVVIQIRKKHGSTERNIPEGIHQSI